MARVGIHSFEAEHVTGAADVLRRRHQRHRAREPLLAVDPDVVALVEHERANGSGVVALDDDEVVGYLLGRHGSGWLGPHVWSTAAGHAVDDELVAELYAAAASGWVARGLTRHFVFAPAIREDVEPWFRLGFGASAVQAVRPIDAAAPAVVDRELTIRRSTPEDLDAVAALARELPLALTTSPSFSELEVSTVASLRDQWRDTWDRDEFTHFLAERGGEAVGQLLLARLEEGDLRIPSRSIDLANATTSAEHRGSGIGSALTAVAIEWATANGFSSMTTDWRATNLSAARFWPRQGFRPTFLRLARSIP